MGVGIGTVRGNRADRSVTRDDDAAMAYVLGGV
jgi:hypothetical protein